MAGPARPSRNRPTRPYCGAHIDVVSALERLRTVLERAAAATDELLATVNRLNERIAKLEVRLSLYAALLGACAGIAGWILGALVVQWLSKS